MVTPFLFADRSVPNKSRNVLTNVTRSLDYLFNIWPFTTIAHQHNFSPKYDQNSAEQIHLRQRFFAKVAKFHQIWSHWYQPPTGSLDRMPTKCSAYFDIFVPGINVSSTL